MKLWWNRAVALVRRETFLAAVTLLALLYVAASLSPSAYGLVLRSLGVEDDGVVLGWPQPIRSDEYAVWTPTVQAAVASNFGPVNTSSFYAENLRTLSALPLADWGLVFKPQFWAFFVLSPARAFSIYHAAHYWIFLVAWVIFLRQLGVGRPEAALATILLLASSWAQTWWTSLGPILVYAPLFLLPLILPLRPSIRAVATFYVAAMWLLDGIFYPPLYVAATLALLLAVLAFRPEVLRPARLAAWGAGAAAGIGMAAVYHWDSLLLTIGSTSHGERNVGGGTVGWQDYLGTFLPPFPYHGWAAIFGINACESSSAGSILWPLILFFAVPASLKTWASGPEGRSALLRSAGLVALFVLATLWILAPIPAVWGKPLLWNLTVPTRLLLLPGLLSLFLALLILPRLELRWSLPRALSFSLLMVGAWLYSERDMPADPDYFSWLRLVHKHSDLALAALAFALPLIEWAKRRWLDEKAPSPARASKGAASRRGGLHVAPPSAPAPFKLSSFSLSPFTLSPFTLLAAAALANLFYFGLFNPLQRTGPIFARHDTPILRDLQAMQDAHPRGWLVAGGARFFGSILNGLGFRSVTQALPNPEVVRLGYFFPEIPEAQRDKLFNRYVNVQICPYSPPAWRQPLREPLAPRENAVLVPPEPFLPDLPVELATAPPSALPMVPGGTTKKHVVGPQWWVLDISGPIDSIGGRVEIEIHTDPPARRLIRTWRMPQVDNTEAYGADLYSRLLVELAAPREEAASATAVEDLGWCIVLRDPAGGARQIGPAPGQGRSTCTPWP